MDSLSVLVNEEIRLEREINSIKEQIKRMDTVLSELRHVRQRKAEEVRRLYFSREANQKQLAIRARCGQSTISRIISGVVYEKH